jgi:hypothetical protein
MATGGAVVLVLVRRMHEVFVPSKSAG